MRELVKKYRNKERYDLSCSEALLHAANDYYNLQLGENEFKMMAAFSGGLKEGDMCGIVSAACSVLGILYTNGVSHTSPALTQAVVQYKTLFKKQLKSLDCRHLVDMHKDEITDCDDLVVKGAVLLREVVDMIDGSN